MRVQRDGRRFTVDVVADGEGVVSHAGAALLAETADRVGLTDELSRALAGLAERRGRHDPGRVVRDLAVMLPTAATVWPICARCATSSRCLGRWPRTRLRFG